LADFADQDPLSQISPADLARLDQLLADRVARGTLQARRVMNSPRYQLLTASVSHSVYGVPVRPGGERPARKGLLPLVDQAWSRFARRAKRIGPERPEAEWHKLRIRAKYARYAAVAVTPAFGKPARAMAKALTSVQDVLGEHQDAAVAAA